MKKYLFFILFSLLYSSYQLMAQDAIEIEEPQIGIDYGGIGANISIFPHKNIGLFLGGGFAIIDFGINGGLKLKYVSDKRSTKIFPFALLMYGYSKAIYISNAYQYNKLKIATIVIKSCKN